MNLRTPQSQPWEMVVVSSKERGSIVQVAREGRLSRYVKGTYVGVGLNLIDEAVLALVGRALARRSNVTFVYPSPAGEVSVLLAAQILIAQLLTGRISPSVGLVTSDTTTAARTWNQLSLGRAGERVALSEVFPCIRAGPNGEYPLRRRQFKGLLVGRQFVGWPCDTVIRDHIAGLAPGEPHVPTISVYGNPLDESLNDISKRGEPIWGWNASDVTALNSTQFRRDEHFSPFSVAADRFATIASGLRTTIRISRNEKAESCAGALKDDLLTLNEMAGHNLSAQLRRGLRAAWHHQRMLQALPVRPTKFDRFGGIPPIAARPTATYEPEMRAWAQALGGEIGELAEIVSSDLADLRSALEDSPPFLAELSKLASQGEEALIIVSNRTAARALVHELGGDVQSSNVGRCQVVSMRTLHRTGTWEKAYVVGMPPRWDWHRLDSGLTEDLHLLVLGDKEAGWARRSLKTLHEARNRWSSTDFRRHAWKRLMSPTPPPVPEIPLRIAEDPEIVGAIDFVPTPDPFEAFEPLLVTVPLFGEEGPSDMLAEEREDGQWTTQVEAVEVATDSGIIRLPIDRIVDVRVLNALDEMRADHLAPGMFLIVNRSAGRVGLLDAIADRLRTHRPDLFVANLVIRDLRASILENFRRSGMSKTDLYDRLVGLGFDKTYQAARGYVVERGPLAPRDYSDLRRLNTTLELGYDERRLAEVFTAVKRERAFRRATGRALASAARRTVTMEDTALVDDDIGLSIADLQELVLEARILGVRRCESPIPLGETGAFLEA